MSKNHTNTAAHNSSIKILQKNKRAYFEYEVLEKYECGIVLLGPEVKSIKAQQVQFTDSFARIKSHVLTLHNLHVSPYKFYTEEAIDPVRIKNLLLHKEELKKITRAVEVKGRTIIPLSLYLKKGLIKLELGVCRGKKLHDKKAVIKQRDIDRDAQREIKSAMR